MDRAITIDGWASERGVPPGSWSDDLDHACRRPGIETGYEFDAFMSYSHAMDGRLAPQLQSALQRFARPWFRRRALRIFRDKSNLTASPALWSSIVTALERSRVFILLSSPDSAASVWVGREVAWWLEHRSPSTILIVLTAGDLTWDERSTRFDDSSETLPDGLRSAFVQEPLWVDLRWAHDAARLDLRNGRFAEAVADLAAPLRGVPKDDLVGEDLKQHRRLRRAGTTALAVIVTLGLLASVAAVQARRAQDRAEASARTATARLWASESSRQLPDRLDLASLYAAAGFALQPSAETRSALAQAAFSNPLLRRHLTVPTRVAELVLTQDDRTGVVGGVDGSLWRIGLDRETVTELPGLGSQVAGLWLSDDDRVAYAWTFDQQSIMVDLASGKRLTRTTSPFSSAPKRSLLAAPPYSPNGAVYAAQDGREVTLRRAADDREVASFSITESDGEVLAVADSGAEAVVQSGTGLVAYRIQRKQVRRAVLSGSMYTTVVALGSGSRLLTAREDRVSVWDLDTDPPYVRTVLSGGFAADEDSQVGAVTSGSEPIVWSDDNLSTSIRRHGRLQKIPGSGPRFSADGDRLVTDTSYERSGELAFWVWHGDRYRLLRRQRTPTDGDWLLALSGDGNRVGLVDYEKRRLLIIGFDSGRQIGAVSVPSVSMDAGVVVDQDLSVVAVEAEGNSVQVTSIDTGQSRRFWNRDSREVSGGVWTIDLSADGSMLAASINGTAIVWTTADGREVARFPAPRSNQLTLVPDRSLLVGRSDEGVIDVWDLSSRRPLGTVVIPDPAAPAWQATNISLADPGHDDTVYVVAQRSGRLLRLEMDPSRWMTEVCSRAGRRLTTDEWLTITGELPAEVRGC